MRRNSYRFVIGITGGIATGKSTVLSEMSRRGIPTVSSDVLAHRCLNPGTPSYRRIVHHFGPGILAPNGQINRTILGRLVFSNPRERHWLERQTHPRVIQGLKRFIHSHRGLLALDIPLLFEAGLENLVDRILVVSSRQKNQIRRQTRRTHLSVAEAKRRIQSQQSLSYKRKHADYVIVNDGSRRALHRQISRVLTALHREARLNNP